MNLTPRPLAVTGTRHRRQRLALGTWSRAAGRGIEGVGEGLAAARMAVARLACAASREPCWHRESGGVGKEEEEVVMVVEEEAEEKVDEAEEAAEEKVDETEEAVDEEKAMAQR